MESIEKFCRTLIMQNNRGHMIRKWDSFSDALGDPDFESFLRQVRRKLPEEKAIELLTEFDYRCGVRKQDCKTNEEFAAAVLGIELDWLRENFGE